MRVPSSYQRLREVVSISVQRIPRKAEIALLERRCPLHAQRLALGREVPGVKCLWNDRVREKREKEEIYKEQGGAAGTISKTRLRAARRNTTRGHVQ